MLREEVLKTWAELKKKNWTSKKTHPGWVVREDILQKALKLYINKVESFKNESFVPDYAKDETYRQQIKSDEEEIAECNRLLKELEKK